MNIKVMLLVSKIRKLEEDIHTHQHDLERRNITYHKGKMNTELLMREFINKKNIEMFSIKREIVELKNSHK